MPLRLARPAAVLAAVVVAVLATGTAPALAEPAQIREKRAEVARIQAELDGYAAEAAVAAEAFNGARWQLGKVTRDIAANRQRTATTERELGTSQDLLATRLRRLYATVEPTPVEIMISSSSITGAVEQFDLLDLIGRRDAEVVGGLRAAKARLATLRRELEASRGRAREAVASRARERSRIEGLLAQRQAVRDGLSDELRTLLDAEQRRQRQEAARRAAAARAAAAAAAPETPTTPTAPATPATPSSTASPSPAPAAPTTPVPSGAGNAQAAQYAMTQLGVPYVWGGASPSVGFDCSGLATWAYAQIGKNVPHYTVAIWNAFPRVPDGQLQPGDLVLFRADLGHMGIYIGGGQYVNSPQTGDVVKVSSMSSRSDFQGAVRP